MKSFVIREIKKEYCRMIVEIEFMVGGDRRKFGYPLGEGWENEINGKPKFIEHIRQSLINEENALQVAGELKDLKSEYEGKKVTRTKIE